MANFGSSQLPPFLLRAMPVLAETPKSWAVLAKRWRKSAQGRSGLDLSVEERRASLRARAAFWAEQVNRVERVPGQPRPVGCTACGQLTFGWCEGSYSRTGEASGAPFGAVCRACDQLHLVCDQCTDRAVTWDDGHQAFQARREGEGDQADTIEIATDPAEPPTRIQLSQLAAEMGCSVETLREQLYAAMGAPASSSS